MKEGQIRMKIQINNKIDSFSIESFVFCCLISPVDSGIYLEEYILLRKATLRGKYEIEKCYYRWQHKTSTLFENDVPITKEIQSKVLNQIISKLEFKSLKDRKGKSIGKSL